MLAANYVAARLGSAYPVLYRGHGELVAHECILDLRGLTKQTGVTVDDVAKRLVDYGFHAPTMSFPVAGTLMVEPTESEDLAEIDRFCEAMLAIRAEIDRVASGEWSPEESPLRRAPHTARALVGAWDRPYPRGAGRLPRGGRPRQVLAPGRPDRPGLRRPQPGLRLPTSGGVRLMAGASRRVEGSLDPVTGRRLDARLAAAQASRAAAVGRRGRAPRRRGRVARPVR